MRHFQHKFYNLFTCNCHSFASNCLNRLAYDGSVEWNVLNVAVLVWLHGQWVDKMSIVRSFFPFLTVTCIGILMAGWSFLIGMAAFSFLLIGWFVLIVYCAKGVECWSIITYNILFELHEGCWNELLKPIIIMTISNLVTQKAPISLTHSTYFGCIQHNAIFLPSEMRSMKQQSIFLSSLWWDGHKIILL